MIRKLLQPFYTSFVLLTFLVCLLIAFPVFFLIGLRDKPLAREIIWHIVHYWAIGWLALIGMPVRRQGTRPVPNKKYVAVANHISYLDTVLIYAALPSYFRTLAKKEMARVPVFGFVYRQLAILVDRSSTHSRAKSMRLMWRMLKNECNVAVFPEGTFNETGQAMKQFYDGAFRLAISAQVPVLPMLFPDTYDRWTYTAWYKFSPGRNRVVYLPLVPTEGLAMEDLPALKQKVYELMEQEMLRLAPSYITDNNKS